MTGNVKRTAEFDDLIARHGQAKTDREKATLETQLWGMSTKGERNGAERRNWLASLLGRSDKGDSIRSYELRGKLYNAPAALWDHMESASISLSEANRLFDRCKDLQKFAKVPFEMLLRSVIEGDEDERNNKSARSAKVLVGEISAVEVPAREVSEEKEACAEAGSDPGKESAKDLGGEVFRGEVLEGGIEEGGDRSSPSTSPVVKIPLVDELILRHKQALTDREKSQIESMLWASLSREKRRGKHAREMRLQEMLGGEPNPSRDSLYTYQARAALSKAPAEMWDCIEKSLIPLGTAVRLYRKCQIVQLRDKITFAAALQVTLEQRPSRRNGAARLAMDDVSQTDEWDSLWEAVNAIGQPRLKELPDAIKRDMCGELRNQIRDVLYTFIAKAKRKSADEGEVTLIIRHQRMARACEILQIDAPSLGKPAELKAAVNRKRAIAKFSHPDANGNGNSEVYQRAIEAYDDIQAYNEFIERKAGRG